MEPGLDDVAWADLAVVLAGLEHGSLNQAAAALQISQSTASRRLARLERTLGARLFDRTPDGLQPTELARQLAPHARLVADQMVDIRRLAQGRERRPRGRVRLAVVDGMAPVLLAPALSPFYADYPDITLDLLGGQAVVDLVRGEADIALRMVRPTAPDLVVRSLGSLAVEPFAAPSLAGGLDQVRWVALHDPALALPESQWLARHVPEAHLTRVSSWNVLFACVRSGVGAGLLPPLVAEAAGLRRLDGPAAPPRRLLLVYHRALREVPRIVAVREWLVRTAEGFLHRARL